MNRVAPETPEQVRDRLLASIDAVLHDGYLAPERKRSKLYAIVIGELNRFAAVHGDVIGHVLLILGLPRETSADEMLRVLRERCGS